MNDYIAEPDNPMPERLEGCAFADTERPVDSQWIWNHQPIEVLDFVRVMSYVLCRYFGEFRKKPLV